MMEQINKNDILDDKDDTMPNSEPANDGNAVAESISNAKQEVGGPKGLEPTRYGDWERAGRCIDF